MACGAASSALPGTASSATLQTVVDVAFLDPRVLAVLEEGRQAIAIRELADESVDIAGGTMSYAGPGVWANQACGIGLRGPISDADLDRIVEFYDARDEPGEIELAAHADASCFRGLATRGFYCKEIESVFAIDGQRHVVETPTLDRLADLGLEMSRITARGDAAQDFVEVGTRGFHTTGKPVNPAERKLLHRVIAHPRTAAWLVRFEGEICGVTAMECAGEVACLFATTVTPKFRCRGIQRALIEARLRHGLDEGCRYVCMHSAAGIATERNARRTSMELCYSKAVLTRVRPS